MPEGLERLIPPQDMADLISFIKNWRYLDESPNSAGRQPVNCRPRAAYNACQLKPDDLWVAAP